MKVLITGAGSYVGESVKKYILASQEKVGRNSGEVREPEWEIDSVDTMSDAWKHLIQQDFIKKINLVIQLYWDGPAKTGHWVVVEVMQ